MPTRLPRRDRRSGNRDPRGNLAKIVIAASDASDDVPAGGVILEIVDQGIKSILGPLVSAIVCRVDHGKEDVNDAGLGPSLTVLVIVLSPLPHFPPPSVLVHRPDGGREHYS